MCTSTTPTRMSGRISTCNTCKAWNISKFFFKLCYYSLTSGFWPCARALRAPPPPPSIAASLLLIQPQNIYKIYKVLTYEEYRAVSGVFQNIDPPPPSPPSECVISSTQGGGYTFAGWWGRWGVNILEDARHKIGLLQYTTSPIVHYCNCRWHCEPTCVSY